VIERQLDQRIIDFMLLALVVVQRADDLRHRLKS